MLSVFDERRPAARLLLLKLPKRADNVGARSRVWREYADQRRLNVGEFRQQKEVRLIVHLHERGTR